MEDFMDAVKTCLRKYKDFTGRASRREYWFFFLFSSVAAIVLGIVAAIIGVIAEFVIGLASDEAGEIVGNFVGGLILFAGLLALFLPNIAAGARRLHDTNKSGWLLLLNFIPVGNIVVLVLLGLKGTDGPNRFGDEPEN